MGIRRYLAARRGLICVVECDRDYSEPIERIRYWPTSKSADGFTDQELASAQVLTHGVARYSARVPGIGFWIDLDLIGGGSCTPIDVETVEVLSPRVRAGIPVRWHSGEWQKCLKSRGWVAA